MLVDVGITSLHTMPAAAPQNANEMTAAQHRAKSNRSHRPTRTLQLLGGASGRQVKVTSLIAALPNTVVTAQISKPRAAKHRSLKPAPVPSRLIAATPDNAV